MTENKVILARQKYVEAFNETMLQIWKEKIVDFGIYDRRPKHEGDHLIDSLRYFPVQADGKYAEITLTYEFLEHGIYVDMGVGKEKYRGNAGFHSDVSGARKPRPWFSTKYYASAMKLKEYMAESMGAEFIGIISDTLTNI